MRVRGILLCSCILACSARSSDSETSGTTGSEATEATGAEAATNDASDGEGGEETGDFPPRPDCHPLAGPECPADQKCIPRDSDADGKWDDWACLPLPRSAGYHDACLVPDVTGARADDCIDGHLCADPSGPESTDGWCAPLCDDAHPCAAGETCLPSPEGFFSWCRPTCDPLADPSECPVPELACSFGIEAHFVCGQRIEVDGQQGEPCVLPTECAAGLTCLSGAVVGPEACGAHAACCTSLCDANAPNCPPEAPTCTPVFADAAEPGFESLGFCGD